MAIINFMPISYSCVCPYIYSNITIVFQYCHVLHFNTCTIEDNIKITLNNMSMSGSVCCEDALGVCNP